MKLQELVHRCFEYRVAFVKPLRKLCGNASCHGDRLNFSKYVLKNSRSYATSLKVVAKMMHMSLLKLTLFTFNLQTYFFKLRNEVSFLQEKSYTLHSMFPQHVSFLSVVLFSSNVDIISNCPQASVLSLYGDPETNGQQVWGGFAEAISPGKCFKESRSENELAWRTWKIKWKYTTVE